MSADVRFGSSAAPQKLTSSTAAIGGKAAIGLDSIQHGLSDNKHPGYAHYSIIQIIGIPSLPNLVSQFLIN